MAPRPLATVAGLAFLYLTQSLAAARSLRTATHQELAQPPPASAPSPAVAAAPGIAPPPADPPPPPPPGVPPAAPPCPLQQPGLPTDQLVKKIKTFGDDAVAGVQAEIKAKAQVETEAGVARIKGAADKHNPLKNPVDSATFAAEATGPLQKIREDLQSNFQTMHEKAEKEAAEVLEKVKDSIHKAAYTTVEATIGKVQEKNQELVKESIEHAKMDSNHSQQLNDAAMKAVQNTMEAIQKVQKASDSLPQDEIKKATDIGKRAQATSAMFTKQALNVKQLVEQYMELDYESHHDVVLADNDQGFAAKTAEDAEAQASTNSADIRVLQASIEEAKQQATQALQKSSRIGSTVLDLSNE